MYSAEYIRVQLSCKVTSAHKLHTGDSQATLEQHASDKHVRYPHVCEWLASKRQLGGKMLH